MTREELGGNGPDPADDLVGEITPVSPQLPPGYDEAGADSELGVTVEPLAAPHAETIGQDDHDVIPAGEVAEGDAEDATKGLDPDEVGGLVAVDQRPSGSAPVPLLPGADDGPRRPPRSWRDVAAAMPPDDKDKTPASPSAADDDQPVTAGQPAQPEHADAPGKPEADRANPDDSRNSRPLYASKTGSQLRATATARRATPLSAPRRTDTLSDEAERPLPRPFDGNLQAVDLRAGTLIGDFRRRDAPVTPEGLIDGDVLADSPTVVLIDHDTAFVGDTYMPLLKYHHPILRAFRDVRGPLRTAQLRQYIGDAGELDEGRMRGDVVRNRAEEVMEGLNRALGFRAIVADGKPGKANINTFTLKDSRVKILEILEESRRGSDLPQPTADELYEDFSDLSQRDRLVETEDLIEVSMHPDSLLRIPSGHIVRVIGHARFILNVLGQQTGLVSPATVKAYGYRGSNDAKFSDDLARLRDYLNIPGGPEILLSTGSYADRRIGLHPYVTFRRSLVELERPSSPLRLQAPFPRKPRRKPAPVHPDPLPEPVIVAEQKGEEPPVSRPSSTAVVQSPSELEVPSPPEAEAEPQTEPATEVSVLSARYTAVGKLYERNRKKEAYRSPEELEAAISELSGSSSSEVRDMVLLYKLSKAVGVPFGPDEHAEEDSVREHTETMFARLDEALWSVPFINPRGRLAEAPILALGLGLPPNIPFVDQLRLTRPSGTVVPYQMIYQVTRERGNDFQRLAEIYDTEPQVLVNIYKRALSKLKQELTKAN